MNDMATVKLGWNVIVTGVAKKDGKALKKATILV